MGLHDIIKQELEEDKVPRLKDNIEIIIQEKEECQTILKTSEE